MQGDVQETEKLVSEKLTHEQQEQWNSTASAMVYRCPGFRHLWMRLLAEANNAGRSEVLPVISRAIPVAATDGQNIIINPDTFFKMKLMERVFVSAHEVVHNVYDDVNMMQRCRVSNTVPTSSGGRLEWDEEVGQKSADKRINAMLVESKIGTMPKDENGNLIGCYDPNMDGTESFVDVYEKEYKKKHKGGKGGKPPGGQKPGNNPGGFDNVLAPGHSSGQSPAQAAQQRNQQQWAMEIAAAQTIEAMKSQGKMAAALKRMFQNVLEPEIDWHDHIECEVQRVVGGDIFDWKEPDPWFIGRDIYLPSKTGHRAGWIVIWGDTSGSRSDKEIASNVAECTGIMEDVRPKRLSLVWGDAEVAHVDEIEDPADMAHCSPKGGGGTEMEPVLKWVDEQNEHPDLLIAFTDGYLTFPKEPPYPVIWASSTDVKYPYGKTVRVLKKTPQP